MEPDAAGPPESPQQPAPAWSFGVEPLPGTADAARLLRSLAGLVLALEADDGEIERLVSELRAAEGRLQARVPVDHRPRVGPAVDSAGRVYLDHARDVGAFNACFPDYQLSVDGDTASGTVDFPLAFEGPPGVVHGGFLAVFFDCAVQHHNCDLGVAGKTTSLALRYRRPTPVERSLQFAIFRSVDGRRITSTGQLLLDGEQLCEAEVATVAGDPAALPVVSPRRNP